MSGQNNSSSVLRSKNAGEYYTTVHDGYIKHVVITTHVIILSICFVGKSHFVLSSNEDRIYLVLKCIYS